MNSLRKGLLRRSASSVLSFALMVPCLGTPEATAGVVAAARGISSMAPAYAPSLADGESPAALSLDPAFGVSDGPAMALVGLFLLSPEPTRQNAAFQTAPVGFSVVSPPAAWMATAEISMAAPGVELAATEQETRGMAPAGKRPDRHELQDALPLAREAEAFPAGMEDLVAEERPRQAWSRMGALDRTLSRLRGDPGPLEGVKRDYDSAWAPETETSAIDALMQEQGSSRQGLARWDDFEAAPARKPAVVPPPSTSNGGIWLWAAVPLLGLPLFADHFVDSGWLAAGAGALGLAALLARKALRRYRAWKSGPEFYDRLLDRRTVEFLPQKDRKLEYKGGILERLASHPVYPWMMYAPLIAALLVAAMPLGWSAAAYVAAGLLLWSLVEYVAHRWFLHLLSMPPSAEHLKHHHVPMDTRKIVLNPLSTGLMAALFYGFFWLLSGPLVGAALLAGLAAGYLSYDTLHYAFHANWKFPAWLSWLRRLKTLHLHHHLVDPDMWFGVTSPLWDFLFDTDYWPPPRKFTRARSAQ